MGVRKYLYTIFAAMAAMMLMAFLGAGPASATVLCSETTTTECTSYGKGTIIDASLKESTTFSTTGGTVLDTCAFGMADGQTSTTGGTSETVKETIEELLWVSCTNTTDTTSKGELEIHWISGTNNGTVTGKNISVTLNTAFGSCTYGTGAALDLGTLTGGNPATIDVNAVLVKQAGGFTCPAEAKWAASYSVEDPEPLYVGQNPAAGVQAPTLKIQNVGGPAWRGTNVCEYTIENQVCELQVTNLSAFGVEVLNDELAGIEFAKRYELVAKCGASLAAGASCLVKVKLITKPVKGWINAYLIRVKKEGGTAAETMQGTGLLKP